MKKLNAILRREQNKIAAKKAATAANMAKRKRNAIIEIIVDSKQSIKFDTFDEVSRVLIQNGRIVKKEVIYKRSSIYFSGLAGELAPRTSTHEWGDKQKANALYVDAYRQYGDVNFEGVSIDIAKILKEHYKQDWN